MVKDAQEYFDRGCGRCKRFDTPECSANVWHDGLMRLRQICLDAGLDETVKWSHPFYMHSGRNIAGLGAFKGDFRLNFLNPSLLTDVHGLLEKSGPNTQSVNTVKFTSLEEIDEKADQIADLLAEAITYAENGIKPVKKSVMPERPQELVDALDADADLAAAFDALTPGRQRSYIIFLNAAKQSKTRVSRIEKCAAAIMAGKGHNE